MKVTEMINADPEPNYKPSGYAANLPKRKIIQVPVISGTFSPNIKAVTVTVLAAPWEAEG